MSTDSRLGNCKLEPIFEAEEFWRTEATTLQERGVHPDKKDVDAIDEYRLKTDYRFHHAVDDCVKLLNNRGTLTDKQAKELTAFSYNAVSIGRSLQENLKSCMQAGEEWYGHNFERLKCGGYCGKTYDKDQLMLVANPKYGSELMWMCKQCYEGTFKKAYYLDDRGRCLNEYWTEENMKEEVEKPVLSLTGKKCTHFDWPEENKWRDSDRKTVAAAMNDLSACIHMLGDYFSKISPEMETIGMCTIEKGSPQILIDSCGLWEELTDKGKEHGLYIGRDYDALGGLVVDKKLILNVGDAANHQTHFNLERGTVDYYDRDDDVNRVMLNLWTEAGLACREVGRDETEDAGVKCSNLKEENMKKAVSIASLATTMDYRLRGDHDWPMMYGWRGGAGHDAELDNARIFLYKFAESPPHTTMFPEYEALAKYQEEKPEGWVKEPEDFVVDNTYKTNFKLLMGADYMIEFYGLRDTWAGWVPMPHVQSDEGKNFEKLFGLNPEEYLLEIVPNTDRFGAVVPGMWVAHLPKWLYDYVFKFQPANENFWATYEGKSHQIFLRFLAVGTGHFFYIVEKFTHLFNYL